jgi:hypothetical protein
MGFERQTVEKLPPLEAHDNVSFFGSREQRAQRRVFGSIGGNVDEAQLVAGVQRFGYRVHAVNQIVEI